MSGRLRRGLTTGAGPWALAFAVLTLVLQWLPSMAQHLQFARADYDVGAWWLLLTAQWVHLSLLHAVVNVLGLTVLLFAFQGLVAARLQVLALLGGYAGVAVLLVLDTDCTLYAGASGALHGLLAGSACALLWGPPPPQSRLTRQRLHLLAGAVLLGLAAKLLVQHFGMGPPSSVGWLGFASFYPAHEAGALGGALAMLLVALAWPLAARALGRHRRPPGPGAGR